MPLNLFIGIDRNAKRTVMVKARTFGSCETLFVTGTRQYDDYANCISKAFYPAWKLRYQTEKMSWDCRKAYELGERLVRKAT